MAFSRIRIETTYFMKLLAALQWLYAQLMRRPIEKRVLFITVLKQFHIKYISEEKLKQCTIEKNELILDNIHRYLKVAGLTGLYVDQVRIKHMEGLKLWLHKNLESCCLTHSARHLSYCRRAIKYAVNEEYLNYNVLESMELKRDQVKEIVYLEWREYLKLATRDFETPIYNQVRDLYVFQCSTGLSYGDLKDYTVVVDRKGREWISDGRNKNEKAYRVPLFAPAKEIHERYNGKLPVIGNAAYNRIIKEIAMQLNIKKKLTTHTARKTFATLRNEEGWTRESISDMMGNTVKVLEKHYLGKTVQRVENELVRLNIVH